MVMGGLVLDPFGAVAVGVSDRGRDNIAANSAGLRGRGRRLGTGDVGLYVLFVAAG